MTSEGRIDSESIQVKLISYNVQGMISAVDQSSTVLESALCNLHYGYDEWDNVRRIQAKYSHKHGVEPTLKESSYDYDAAGRITVSNGILSSGKIFLKKYNPSSVSIVYDSDGRRIKTTEFNSSHALTHTPKRTWDTMRDESYTYNDLGILRLIEQHIREVNIMQENLETGGWDPKDDENGNWHNLSSRQVNLRGDVVRVDQWSRIPGPGSTGVITETPNSLGTTNTSYRLDGQVLTSSTDAADPNNSTVVENYYHEDIGLLDYYKFRGNRSDGTPFSTRFEYRYTFQNGRRAVTKIHDVFTSLLTTKSYDKLGRLSTEYIDLQNPCPWQTDPLSDRYEDRSYMYNAEGHIISKDTQQRLKVVGCDVPLLEPAQQIYVYAGNRIVGMIPADRLDTATKFDFAYSPMSEVSGSGTSRYIVQRGESLVDIAKANYGDGALWYLIADANSVITDPFEPLETTEFGKAYEIPDAVRSSQTATTFNLFGMGEIIGNDRPIAIPPPRPPKYSDIELLAVSAASIAFQVGVSVGLSMLGVPAPISYALGAGFGNLAGQVTSWSLGIQAPDQHGIDLGDVGVAALEGYAFSVAGRFGALSREIWQKGKSGFSGWTSGPGLNLSGLNLSGIAGSLFNVGFDALDRVVGGPVRLGGFINSAYNPRSGWAIPGSKRNPELIWFDFGYAVHESGLANAVFDGIRKRLETPSDPTRRQVRSVDYQNVRISADNNKGLPSIQYRYQYDLDSAKRSDEELLNLANEDPIIIEGKAPTNQLSDEELLNLANEDPIIIEGTLHQYDNLFAAAKAYHGRLINVYTPEEFERIHRFQTEHGSTEYSESWTQEERFDYARSTVEEQKFTSESKWFEFINKAYMGYLDDRAADWYEATRKMSNYADIGKLIGWGTVVIGGLHVLGPSIIESMSQ